MSADNASTSANHSINPYLKEFKYLKSYVITSGILILICFSVFLFSDEEGITKLGDEDQVYEWLTCIFFAAACLFFFLAFLKNKNWVFLLFSFVFLFGAGEEISWGQRVFGFQTPETLLKENVQKEFNIHNLELFNNKDLNGKVKHSLEKMMDLNFLFKIFVILYGIALPLCVYHIKFISGITENIRIPVPPVSIGIFFLVSWLIYQVGARVIFASCSNACFASIVEIFECSLSLVLMAVSFYFYRENRIVVPGKDIKQVLK
jgi:hypothetical protein